MMDRSLSFAIAIFSVLGIGVALKHKMWACPRKWWIISLCFTPKRCSSSTMSSASFLNFVAVK